VSGFLFNRMAVIGVGLLGGSMAWASKRHDLVGSVCGFGRNENRLKQAKAKGILDDFSLSLETTLKDADLVVLATPIGLFRQITEQMMGHLKKGCVVTDLGSVKSSVVKDVEPMTLKAQVDFVPSHPIAGGENSGFEFSKTDLFEGKFCVVTPTKNTPLEAQTKICKLWETLGARVEVRDPEEHDRLYAATSHLPHVLAYALINTLGQMKTKQSEEYLSKGGNGLIDVVRLGASEPNMWRDICLSNKEFILESLKDYQFVLDNFKEKIAQGDGAFLYEAFLQANDHYGKVPKRND
jgi:prephenate dehydrogenase